jgi:hypothetical protein
MSDDNYDPKKLSEDVEKIFESLTPEEAKVLRMRFGIDVNTDHALEEVSKQFDATRERIKEIEKKAIKKIRAFRSNPDNWELVKVITEGEILEIDGLNVWDHEWIKFEDCSFEVPNPVEPNHRPDVLKGKCQMNVYYMSQDNVYVYFATGETSNGIWAFYRQIQ